eukprot:scaffold554428_cov17-Prasinocladus_malaysianus.AAC.1
MDSTTSMHPVALTSPIGRDGAKERQAIWRRRSPKPYRRALAHRYNKWATTKPNSACPQARGNLLEFVAGNYP